LPGLRRGKEYRFDIREIVFFTHALHEDRTHHATPTYKPNSLHVTFKPFLYLPGPISQAQAE